MAACSDCRFAEPAMEGDGQPVVQCRRYPPAPVVVEDEVLQFYPQVEEGDWCGEFQATAPPKIEVRVQPGARFDLSDPQWRQSGTGY